VRFVEVGQHRDGVDQVERGVRVVEGRQRPVRLEANEPNLGGAPGDRLAVDVAAVELTLTRVGFEPAKRATAAAAEVEDALEALERPAQLVERPLDALFRAPPADEEGRCRARRTRGVRAAACANPRGRGDADPD
jgi:hypothetical protein